MTKQRTRRLLIGRNSQELTFNGPISPTEDITENLDWSDLTLYGDLIETDPNVLYIHDTAYNRIYWGHVDDTVFKRQPSTDVEQEMLKELA